MTSKPAPIPCGLFLWLSNGLIPVLSFEPESAFANSKAVIHYVVLRVRPAITVYPGHPLFFLGAFGHVSICNGSKSIHCGEEAAQPAPKILITTKKAPFDLGHSN